jgi:hypothetical protein
VPRNLVSRFGKRHRAREHPFGRETRIDGQDFSETREQQPCPDQQNECTRDLRDDETAAKRLRATPARRRSPFFPEDTEDIGRQHRRHRNQSEYQTDGGRGAKCIEHHDRVECDVMRARQSLQADDAHCAKGNVSDGDAGHSRQERQQ